VELDVMRVVFVTYPGPSFFYPLVSLGWAMRAAGHEVLVATSPSYAADAAKCGLPSVSVGPDIDVGAMFLQSFRSRLQQTRRLPDSWPLTVAELAEQGLTGGALSGIEHFRDVAAEVADDLIAFGRAWRPDVVVYDPGAIAGPLLARVLGIPAVRHVWGPDFFHWIAELETEPLAPLAERFGLERIGVWGDLTVDPCPAAMRVPYNGIGMLPEWLRSEPERPRVCLTWGTWLQNMAMAHLLRGPDIIPALDDVDAEFVVTSTEAERALVRDVPENVRMVDPVPLHLLLPSCAAIIHQGGTGTTMTAATYGVPQLAVPQIPDQLFNAGRMAASGVGRYLPPSNVSVDALLGELAHVLTDPEIRRTAGTVRDDVEAQPPLAEVVAAIEAIAGRAATSRPLATATP
jgi:UDP:flavonoid glycosyltransferase YjiC (YdhE family)